MSVLLMLAIRALDFTIYSVDGEGLQPVFLSGDRVMVNRWSYGLRTGIRTSEKSVGGLFSYGRLCRQPVRLGDIVAYENPTDSVRRRVLFGRVALLPGDTLCLNGRMIQLPSIANCADADYYWIEALGEKNPLDSRQLGYISERFIIGRAFMVVYSHQPEAPFWRGYRTERWMMKK
jgi:signal peptidase I